MLESVREAQEESDESKRAEMCILPMAVAAHREFSFPSPPLYRYAWTYLGCVALGIYIFAFIHFISLLLPFAPVLSWAMSAKPEVPDVWEEDWESQADVCEVHVCRASTRYSVYRFKG